MWSRHKSKDRWFLKRKGFLFTTLAVLIVTGIVIYISAQDRLYPRTQAQLNRVHTMDAYLENLEEDLPRAAYISCFRSLISMEEHISSQGAYISDFDTAFNSIFTNGSLNGTNFSIMNQSSFIDFTQRFQTMAARQGMIANLSVLAVNASQSTPWYVDIAVQIHISVRDAISAVAFNRTVTVVAQVPITDVKDPLHSIGTQGKAPRVVRQSNVTAPYIGANNDTTKLEQLLNSTEYIASPLAPSFLQRFSGNLSASPYGIVSLVDIAELRAQGITTTTCRSVVDYVYFGLSNSNPNRYIENMDDNIFWLDDANLPTFNASSSVSGSASCP